MAKVIDFSADKRAGLKTFEELQKLLSGIQKDEITEALYCIRLKDGTYSIRSTMLSFETAGVVEMFLTEHKMNNYMATFEELDFDPEFEP